ncbi:MAG: efflux RND transporter periplasmic adaptor subunit [Pseudomonadota bacterium]
MMIKRVSRYLLVALIIFVLLAVGYLVIVKRPLSVEGIEMEHDVPVQVFGLGTVEARILSKVGFEVDGMLVELAVDHGERVKQDTVLARLHSAEQQVRVTKAQANVTQAEAALRKDEATLVRSRAILKQRQQTNRRQQALAKQKAASQEVVDEAHMNEVVAAANVTVTESEIAVARANLQDAHAQLTLETTILDHYTLYAPYNGVVIKRHKELGTVLNPGEPLFTLVDPASVWALAYVDEARAGHLQLGQPAEVRLRSRPNEPLLAHVVRIDIESDRVSEERRVYVKCDQCPTDFHLGEQVEVFITVATLPEALLVPEVAVDLYDGVEGTVWTVEEGALQQRKVRFGHRTLDGRLEITGGLVQDARVLAKWPPGLRAGRTAQLIASESP